MFAAIATLERALPSLVVHEEFLTSTTPFQSAGTPHGHDLAGAHRMMNAIALWRARIRATRLPREARAHPLGRRDRPLSHPSPERRYRAHH